MIESFRHKGLKRFYQQDDRSKLPPDMVERIAVILAALDAAATIAALKWIWWTTTERTDHADEKPAPPRPRPEG